MLNQTSKHTEEAQRFTSLISRRIAAQELHPDTPLPSLDSAATTISTMAADIAALKLYAAILSHRTEVGFSPMLEALLWIISRCSDEQRNAFFTGMLNSHDNLATTQKKLILLQDGKFFYNQFLSYELHGPILALIQQFNQIQQIHYLGDNIYATVADVVKHYNALSILSPIQEDTDILIEKTRRGLALKTHFASYLNEVNDLIRKIQEERPAPQPETPSHEAFMGLYKTNAPEQDSFNIAGISKNANNSNDDNSFLISTADITMPSKPKKNIKVDQPSVKRNVLTSLKKSSSATYY